MTDTTRLQLPLIAAAQAQKHVTHNEAIMRLDGLVQMTALSYSTSAQPASPSDGDLYLLPAGKTGDDWGGYSDHAVAHYYDGIWHQYHPNEGWLSFVQDAGYLYYYDGSEWAVVPATSMAAGSASAPGLPFGIDTDTGIYRRAANWLAFATAGVRRYSIDGNGNHYLETATGVDQKINMYRADNGYGQYLNFYPLSTTASGNVLWTFGRLPSDDNFSITNWNGSSTTTSFYFKDTGDVGIGTSSPNCLLDVAGQLSPHSDNAYTLGDSSHRWSTVYAATGTINTSDAREKTDIADADLGLDFIASLKARKFKWICGGKEKAGTQTLENGITEPVLKERPGKRTHYGLIAQEVRQALDAAGAGDFAGWVLADAADPQSTQGLRYDQLIAPLIKAVQELAAANAKLEARVAKMEG